MVFVSNTHRAEYDQVPDIIADISPVENLIGCSGGGVIGEGKEVENRAAVSITGAILPDVHLNFFPR